MCVQKHLAQCLATAVCHDPAMLPSQAGYLCFSHSPKKAVLSSSWGPGPVIASLPRGSLGHPAETGTGMPSHTVQSQPWEPRRGT